jgi:ATP-binding cassette, subfamily F, member 3
VLLVTHDRYLIRSVADDLIEVRGGTARFHHGVDERVLTPVGPTTRREEPPAAAPAKQAAPAPARKAPKKPAAPAKDAQRERELRKEVNKLEKRWEQAEAKVAELQQALADPDVYADVDRVTELSTALDAAKDDAVRLMTEWEQAASRLERMG